MENLNTVRGVLEEERAVKGNRSSRLSNQLEEFAVGGLHLEIIGLLWLFLGVLGTAFPMRLRHYGRRFWLDAKRRFSANSIVSTQKSWNLIIGSPTFTVMDSPMT
jgi:hypothetical protein